MRTQALLERIEDWRQLLCVFHYSSMCICVYVCTRMAFMCNSANTTLSIQFFTSLHSIPQRFQYGFQCAKRRNEEERIKKKRKMMKKKKKWLPILVTYASFSNIAFTCSQLLILTSDNWTKIEVNAHCANAL